MVSIRIVTTVTVDRPIQTVWDFLSVPESLVLWTGTQEVRRTSSGEWGVGSTFDTTAEYRGKRGDHTYRVSAFERPSLMAVQGKWDSAPVDATLELSPSGEGTLVRETVELHPPSRWWSVPFLLFGWLGAWLVGRYQKPEMDTLKAVVESGGQPASPAAPAT